MPKFVVRSAWDDVHDRPYATGTESDIRSWLERNTAEDGMSGQFQADDLRILVKNPFPDSDETLTVRQFLSRFNKR